MRDTSISAVRIKDSVVRITDMHGVQTVGYGVGLFESAIPYTTIYQFGCYSGVTTGIFDRDIIFQTVSNSSGYFL